MVVFVVYIVSLLGGFLFYIHLLSYEPNWILYCNLYGMSCLYEVRHGRCMELCVSVCVLIGLCVCVSLCMYRSVCIYVCG
jgi:hypothetical protein